MFFRNARFIFLAAALLLLFSACTSPEVEPDAEIPQPVPTVPSLDEAEPEPPAAESPEYPAPVIVAPATPTLNPDYPAPPTLAPTVDPYPGGLVWVIRPVGIQCEEGTVPGYGDLREAISTLTAAGVTVADAEMTDLMVTTSCGSPTSAHFRMQIAAEDLHPVLSMGWTQE